MFTAMIVILLCCFICLIVYLAIDEAKWEKLARQAIKAGCCPFCGKQLEHYRFESKEGTRDSYYCKSCDFSVSTEVKQFELANTKEGIVND